MPHQVLNLEEAADCLHMPASEISRLVKEHEIPFETRGQRTVFRKVAIETWGSQRILRTEKRRTASRVAPVVSSLPEKLLPGLLNAHQIEGAVWAQTRASILREMIDLAGRSGWITDSRTLLDRLEAREKVSSTAMPGGVAFLHAPSQDPDLFERSFVALGRTVHPIHFGASDARPTSLFFLLCSRDAQQHLAVLARLCRLVRETEVLDGVFKAPDSAAMLECLLAAECELLARDAARLGLDSD